MKRTVRYQAAIIRDHSILMLKVWDHADTGQVFWCIPGGGRNSGESDADCVRREVLEETHLQIEIDRLIMDEEEPPGDTYRETRTFACRILSGDPQPGIEPEIDSEGRTTIKELGWFDLRDESGWDSLALSDPITCSKLRRLRQVLGYLENS